MKETKQTMDAEVFDCDVVVVGAGMFGSSAAKYLAQCQQPALRVVLIGPREQQNRRDTDIHSAHYDEGRITRTAAVDPVWAILNSRTAKRLRDIEKQSGFHVFHEVGFLYVALRDGPTLNALRQNDSQSGEEAMEPLDSASLRTRFPYLQFDNICEGRYSAKDSGHISPRKLVKAQVNIAQQYGCDVVYDVVRHVIPLGNSGYRIETDTGRTLSARKVLIATGAFTNHRHLLPGGQKPRLQYQCETTLLIEVHRDDVSSMHGMPSFGVRDIEDGKETGFLAAYVLPPIKYPNGKFYVKLGHGNKVNKKLSSPQEIQDWFTHGQDIFVERHLMAMARKYFPGLPVSEYHFDRCITCRTPTGHPYVDIVAPGLGVALGGCGYGAKACDEIGRMAARMIKHDGWDHDLPASYFHFQTAEQNKIAKL